MKRHRIEMGGRRGGKEFARQMELQKMVRTVPEARKLVDDFREKFPMPQIPKASDMEIEQAKSRLWRNGRDIDCVFIDESSHLSDAIAYGLGAKRVFGGPRALSEYENHELVMEMLKRGFAVMPIPDQGPPDVLK